MGTLTMKFGGASVGTTTALTQVVSIILQEVERWNRLILIVSALEGVTDALLEATQLAQLTNRRGYRRIVATIRTRHLALVEQLPLNNNERSALQADIDRLLFDMLDTCQTMENPTADGASLDTIDAVIGVGERLAARIVAALLRQNGLRGVAIDAPEIIITDQTYGNAIPDMILTSARIKEHLLPMLDRKVIPVITGFIAGTVTGKPTTLGRGGSDYTASILSVTTNASEVWIWTDVDGMMTTDPREIPQARVIESLSYDEVAELAYFGAKVLHSRMIGPLREQGIALRIKNVFKPQQPGTRIHHNTPEPQSHQIKAVTMIQGIGLTAHRSGSLSEISGLVNQVLSDTIGSYADVMITSQSFTETFIAFVIPTSAGPDAIHTAQSAVENALNEHPEALLWQVRPVTILTAIGSNIDRNPASMAEVFQSVGNIRVLALSLGASGCSLSLVVEPEDADIALQNIHELTHKSSTQ